MYINLDDIEPRIRPHVKALVNAGWETTSSCGHNMYITLKGGPQDVLPLYKTLKELGYKDFELTYNLNTRFEDCSGLTITFDGELRGNGKPFDLVLLKVEPESHPLYFVVRSRDYGNERNNESEAFFYEEHTCPTNWTDDILAVISQGDPDPHGFVSFVARTKPPEKMDDDGNTNGRGDDIWAEVFPEAFTA